MHKFICISFVNLLFLFVISGTILLHADYSDNPLQFNIWCISNLCLLSLLTINACIKIFRGPRNITYTYILDTINMVEVMLIVSTPVSIIWGISTLFKFHGMIPDVKIWIWFHVILWSNCLVLLTSIMFSIFVCPADEPLAPGDIESA